MSAVLSLRENGPRHFLDLKDFSGAELRALLDSAAEFQTHPPQRGQKTAGRQDAGNGFREALHPYPRLL